MAAATVAGRRLHADAIRSISNTPSFRTHDNLNVHWNGKLQLLSNMSAGQQCDRTVVLATSLVPEAGVALAWATERVCRPGDAVHLVHVICCLTTSDEVYHPGPGNTFAIDDQPHDERQEVLRAQALIKEWVLPILDPRLFYMTHLFVCAWNAPPETVGAVVLRVAHEVHASCIVVAANDQPDLDPMRLGGTTKWLLQHSQKVPIALVRKLGATTAHAWRADAAAASNPDRRIRPEARPSPHQAY